MPIAWSVFKLQVIAQLTDHVPTAGTDTLAVEAVAEYVLDVATKEIAGNLPVAKSHENRYRTLRRKLAGRVSSLSAANFNLAVRSRLQMAGPSDDIGYRYIGAITKAEIAREYEQDPVLQKSFMESAIVYKMQMLGRTFISTEGTTITEVRARYLPLDSATLNFTAFIDESIRRARDDLQTFKLWVDGVIAAGLESLQSVAARVQTEILNEVIALQELVPGLRASNFVSFTSATLVDDGWASRGLMPENCRPIAGWIVDLLPVDEDAVVDADGNVIDPCRRTPCRSVPWSQSQDMTCSKTCAPQVSFEHNGRCFFVTPRIVSLESTFQLQFAGIKTTYVDADLVSFDNAVVVAVAEHVKFTLANEDQDQAAARTAGLLKVIARRRVYRNERQSREFEPVDDAVA